jgi:hypothetical protein
MCNCGPHQVFIDLHGSVLRTTTEEACARLFRESHRPQMAALCNGRPILAGRSIIDTTGFAIGLQCTMCRCTVHYRGAKTTSDTYQNTIPL